jgi:hypothetical protein
MFNVMFVLHEQTVFRNKQDTKENVFTSPGTMLISRHNAHRTDVYCSTAIRIQEHKIAGELQVSTALMLNIQVF